MATIDTRLNKDGTTSYRVSIRKKGQELYKTFSTEEDAKLYAWHKERLIDNMANFDVPLKDRVRFKDILTMKMDSLPVTDTKTMSDFKLSGERICNLLPDLFMHEISYDTWLKCAKDLLDMDVYRGARTELAKRKMSPNTVRRHFACASSGISYAQSKGINIDNHALKVMQTFITPLINSVSEY